MNIGDAKQAQYMRIMIFHELDVELQSEWGTVRIAKTFVASVGFGSDYYSDWCVSPAPKFCLFVH